MPCIDIVSKLKDYTKKIPLIMQGEVNSLLYQEDLILHSCVKKAFSLFPDYTRDYYVKIMMGWLQRKKKRYSFYDSVSPSCLKFLMECSTKNEDKFIALLKDASILRGIHYVFIGSMISDFENMSDAKCLSCRKKYGVDVIPQGEIKDLEKNFNKVIAIQETIEKPFYKKVIAMAIGISNNNPEFIADNFMEGARGLRKAIWRFNIYNGGVLAGFIDIWINNELLLFQPCNLIKVPTGLNALHNKVMEGINKGNTFAQSAKDAGMTEKRAKDIELMLNKEADIRIDIAVGNGVSDDSDDSMNNEEEPLDENLIVGFDDDEKDESLAMMLSTMKLEDKKMLCLHFGLFDLLMEKVDITKEDIQQEIKRQNENCKSIL